MAAANMLSVLSDPLYKVSDDASHSRGVLEDLVTALHDAQEMLQDAHDQAMAGGLEILPDGTVKTPVVTDAAVAADQARLAQQVRTLIDQAVVLANQADDTAAGALAAVGQGLKRFFGLPDSMSPGNPEMGLWIMNSLYGRAGDVADGVVNGPLGKLAALGPDGMPLDPATMTNKQQFMAGLNGQFAAASPDVAGLRNNLGLLSRVAGPASGAIGAIGSGVAQYNKDASTPNMGGAERIARAGHAGFWQGGASFAGGFAGAKIGMAIGTFGGPVAGAVVGGFFGSELGGAYVNATIADFGNGVEAVGNGLGAAGRAAGGAIDAINPW